MRKRTINILIILLQSCAESQSENHSVGNIEQTNTVTSVLDSLEVIEPDGKCSVIYTRIRTGSSLSTENKIELGKSGSTVLTYQYYYHCPGWMDDQNALDLYFLIPNDSLIHTDSIYQLPSDLVLVKGVQRGAWIGMNEIYNIAGALRFDSYSHDTTVLSLKITGLINYFQGEPSRAKLLTGSITFLRNGRLDWETVENPDDWYGIPDTTAAPNNI